MATSAPLGKDVSKVYCTAELAARPERQTDYLKEKQALQELAATLAESPEGVLPRFVDLAMEITGGVSAGLSLYEATPAPGVFRWRYLRGLLAKFENTTTPRSFSPCGVTLDQRQAVLAQHPERVYNWISDAGIIVPEVLLVPLYLGSDEPAGTIWVVATDTGHFHSGHARLLNELASFVGLALRVVRNEEQMKESLEVQRAMTAEMEHRVKNVFMLVEGMIRRTMKHAENKEDLARALSGRLHALASAHSLARRTGESAVTTSPRLTPLSDLIKAILLPHSVNIGGDDDGRISVGGPDVLGKDNILSGMSLVLHELATNAAKHGALSHDVGRLTVGWHISDELLTIHWKETTPDRGSASPDATGYGKTLIDTILSRQLNGQLERDWIKDGLHITIALPMTDVAENTAA